jgi:hypothetical protein
MQVSFSISKDLQKWMAERSSAIHFCPLLPAQTEAGQRTEENVKILISCSAGLARIAADNYHFPAFSG